MGKRHCEKWLDENSDVPYTIVRIPAVMGSDDPTGRMWWWVQRAMDGGGVIISPDALGAYRLGMEFSWFVPKPKVKESPRIAIRVPKLRNSDRE